MATFGNGLNVVIICWLIFLFYWLGAAFFVKRSVTKRNWRREILWRLVVIIIVIAFARYDKPALLSVLGYFFPSSFISATLGSVLTILGLSGAIWARIYLGRNWSGYVSYKENHELVTTGPYRFVRHPIYTSMILMSIGTAIYYGSLFLSIIFTISSIFYILRARQEEKLMIGLFGKRYSDYMKSTKALIPFVY